MTLLNREKRQTLRRIQAHLYDKMLTYGTVVEQMGTVDIFFHPSNPDPHLNCIIPHQGVAWVRRQDLCNAFVGLERLGRLPQLVFQDELFPVVFQQQLQLMGLALEQVRAVMFYYPSYGPYPLDEVPRGRLPDTFDYEIAASIPTAQTELATWLRIFRSGYYNTELLTIEPTLVQPLVEAAEQGKQLFALATYRGTPLGTARASICQQSAEIEAVVTPSLWYGMGLEEALLTTTIRACLARDSAIIFAVVPFDDTLYLYRRLGFVALARMLTFGIDKTSLSDVCSEENET